MDHVNTTWLAWLAGSAAWSTIFGLASQRRLRLLKLLGLLASYVFGVALFIALPWRDALVTWLVMSALGSGVYLLYETYCFLFPNAPGERPVPRLATILGGLFAWPIMLPEAIEYLLADLGVLKPAAKGQDGA